MNCGSSEVAYDSGGGKESTTFDNNDGTHTITALESGVTLYGAGASDTFGAPAGNCGLAGEPVAG